MVKKGAPFRWSQRRPDGRIDTSCLLQHGSPEAVSKVEQRRHQALMPVSPTDHLHALLLKHRDGELWPVQPAERDHFKRVLGLLPPFPHPAAPVGAAQAQAAGPSQAAQNGNPPNSGASPMLDTW